MKKQILSVLATAFIAVSASKASALDQRNDTAEIRVYNDFQLPMEPATLFSMSEYNLSKCLFSTLFVLDESSVPTSELLDSWKYISKESYYELVIKSGITWSDGKPFTASNIKDSILRLEKVAPTHFHSIASLLMKSLSNAKGVGSLQVDSEKNLRVYVQKPNPDLFARLTAVFIPMVRQDLLDPQSLRVSRHDVTLAPYILDVKKTTTSRLRLIKNSRYFSQPSTTAKTIEMRPYPSRILRAEDIMRKDFWANLLLDLAYTPQKVWDEMKSKNISIWSRPVDRILYIYPTKKGTERENLSAIMRWFGGKLEANPITFSDFPGMVPATSLQPKGFFLHEDIKFDKGTVPEKNRPFKVAILSNLIPGEYLKREFAERGMEIVYEQFPISKFKDVREASSFDFIIAAFGAADPDPVTWLSLVLGNEVPFIADYDHAYRREFEQIKNDLNEASRFMKLRKLIARAGREGLYVPLSHYSSIAVANPSLDLSKISQTDETVILSNVIVKRNRQ